MAYYTISSFLHQDIYGLKPNNGILPEHLTEEVFDYIFLGKTIPTNSGIAPEILQEIRQSFTYWYPMDLRCSGKDLINNHLTMTLYNHAAVFKSMDWMPRSYFCNGYINVNGKKMGKQLGNFYTVEKAIKEFSADVTRITLADSQDGLDDADFRTEIAKANIDRLFTFENFLKLVIEAWTKNNEKIGDIDNLNLTNYFDKIFENNINYLIEKSRNAFEAMKYKEVMKFAYYEMINIKNDYVLFLEEDYSKINPTLFMKYLKVFFTIVNPIAPHWTEYMYRTYMNPLFQANGQERQIVQYLGFTKFPEVSKTVDVKLFKHNSYVKGLVKMIFENLVGKKEKPSKYKGIIILLILATFYYAKDFNPGQQIAIKILQSSSYENNRILDDYKSRIMTEMKTADNNSRTQALMFASFIVV